MTNEIKAKAQYLGCKCKHPDYSDSLSLTPELINKEVLLILKPLSAITDEDAIEVAKVLGSGKPEEILKYKDKLYESFTSPEWEHNEVAPIKILFTYQYLQSKGYDFPNLLLSGETLQAAGLAIHEQTI